MAEGQRSVNSVQDIEVGTDATTVAALLDVLKDVDIQRIAKDDAVVIRKGLLALIPAVAALEERIVQLERASSRGQV
jgi:hypothetical protein